MVDKVQFYIVDLNQSIVDTFTTTFADLSNVSVERTNILSRAADCIVSPGNSKGLMDGGVDGPINYALNYIDTRVVRPRIMKEYYGEQPVGTCMFVATGVSRYPILAHTPTMRIPTDVSETENAYTAMRSLLREISLYNDRAVAKGYTTIKSVLLTPFCTGAGCMSASTAAKQMRLAYDTTIHPTECSWDGMGTTEKALIMCGRTKKHQIQPGQRE